MRPTHLSLRNFKSHDATDLDLTVAHVASISGSNGAGKSTILDSIVYALFGPDGLGLGRRANTVIREGADAATVRMRFDLAGTTYEVERTRKITDKTTLELRRIDGDAVQSLAKGTVKDTQAAIEELVGCNADTFVQSVYVRQGDAGRWVHATAAERKQTLVQALDLEQYPPLATSAREYARADQSKLDAAQHRIGDLQANLAELDVPTLQPELARARTAHAQEEGQQAKLVETHVEANKAVEDARVANASGEAARQRVTDLEQRLVVLGADKARTSTELESRRTNLSAAQTRAQELDALSARQPDLVDIAPLEQAQDEAAKAIEAVRVDLQEWNDEQRRHHETKRPAVDAANDVEAARVALDAARERVKTFDAEPAPTCPTCAQDVVGDARAATRATLVAIETSSQEACDAAWQRHREARAAHDQCPAPSGDRFREIELARLAADESLTRTTAALRAARERNDQHHALTTQIANARSAAEQLPDLEQAVREADAATSGAGERVAAAEREHAEAVANLTGDAAERIAELVAARDDAARAVVINAAEINRLARLITQLESELRTAERVQAQLDTERAATAPLEAACARWHFIARAFGRDGIPAQVIRHARPQIEHDANTTLAKGDAPYRVRLDLERDTKAGDTRDTLDITILAGGNERPFDLLSGGEQYRVAVALRLAIGKVLANRSGRRIETLVLDEPEGLDAAGFSAMSDLLLSVRDEFGLILTVSHTDGLDAACDTRIPVEKVDGASRAVIAA